MPSASKLSSKEQVGWIENGSGSKESSSAFFFDGKAIDRLLIRFLAVRIFGAPDNEELRHR